MQWEESDKTWTSDRVCTAFNSWCAEGLLEVQTKARHTRRPECAPATRARLLVSNSRRCLCLRRRTDAVRCEKNALPREVAKKYVKPAQYWASLPFGFKDDAHSTAMDKWCEATAIQQHPTALPTPAARRVPSTRASRPVPAVIVSARSARSASVPSRAEAGRLWSWYKQGCVPPGLRANNCWLGTFADDFCRAIDHDNDPSTPGRDLHWTMLQCPAYSSPRLISWANGRKLEITNHSCAPATVFAWRAVAWFV